MPAVTVPEESVILRDTDWDTYEQFLEARGETKGRRFYYCDGDLEIAVVSLLHKDGSQILAALVPIVASERKIDVYRAGSTTFKRKDLAKGFEPDACFYFEHAWRMRKKRSVDLAIDPGPELIIEVDMTSGSLNRFPIYRAIRVKEIWRYSGGAVTMYALTRSGYEAVAQSLALPIVTPEAATRWVDESHNLTNYDWEAKVRQWVRSR